MLRKVAYIGLELKERSIPEKVERKTQETDKFLYRLYITLKRKYNLHANTLVN